MDRSDSVEFNKKFYRDGRRGFLKGRTLKGNPWPSGTMAYKSWQDGWCDEQSESMIGGQEPEADGKRKS